MEIGARLGRFIVLRPLGAGGMGEVYEARDPELERSVALKVLRSDRPGDEGALRLVREAQALAQLQHPNVVSVHEVGVAEGRVFIAMEYVDGKTLDAVLEEKRSFGEVLGLLVQAGRGLAAAHARSIVHRDFKPSNVLIDREGRVRVGDFGLARLVAGEDSTPSAGAPVEDSSSHETIDGDEETVEGEPKISASGPLLAAPLTVAGSVVGTPRYMAPEQRARRQVTARSDQFSFCLVAWEALHGALPPARRRSVPRWLSRLLEVGLASEPAERHPSMAELVDILERRPVARRRMLAAAIAVAVAGGAAAVVAATRSPAVSCDPAEARARLAGVWNGDARARARAAFVATGTPHAEDEFARVAKILDGRLDGWAAAQADVCAATHVRGEQSDELLDVRTACLLRARRQIEALVETWQHEVVLDRAEQAALAVGDVAACKDAVTSTPLPVDAEARRRIEDVTRRLDVVKGRVAAGQPSAALGLARTAAVEARELAYAPLLAEALITQGDLEADAGSLADGLELLRQGAIEAGHARDDALLARALMRTSFYIGARDLRFAEALTLLAAAEAVVARAGNQSRKQIELLRLQAMLLDGQGKYAESLPRLQRALAVAGSLYPGDHVEKAAVLEALAISENGAGLTHEAIAHFEQAIAMRERTVGPDSSQLVSSLNNLGLALTALGELDRAAAVAERSLMLRERLFVPDHPKVAYGLLVLARVRILQKRDAEARPLAERALAIREQALGPDHALLSEPLLNLAQLDARAGDLEAARRRFERAHELNATLGPDDPSVARGLTIMGEALLEAGDLSGARGAYERAAVIRRKRKDPDCTAQQGLGLVALAEGKPEVALGFFTEALTVLDSRKEESTTTIEVLRQIAEASIRARKPEAAAATLERALKIVEARPELASAPEVGKLRELAQRSKPYFESRR